MTMYTEVHFQKEASLRWNGVEAEHPSKRYDGSS
jgi:hypothetical protein